MQISLTFMSSPIVFWKETLNYFDGGINMKVDFSLKVSTRVALSFMMLCNALCLVYFIFIFFKCKFRP